MPDLIELVEKLADAFERLQLRYALGGAPCEVSCGSSAVGLISTTSGIGVQYRTTRPPNRSLSN
jgi:hypothetical protein